MRIIDIISEFSDYRAYVSHTLWNHRVLLALDNAESVKRRLHDASIWPLTHRECGRLADLFGSLFGFVCAPVEEHAFEPMRKVLVLQKQCAIRILDGDLEAHAGFVKHTLAIRDCLTGITGLLKEHRLGFNPDATHAYLGGRDLAKCINELRCLIDGRVMSIFAAVLKDISPCEDYAAFWVATEDARLQCRVVRVAAAMEDAVDKVEALIQRTNLALQQCERVISCWSPSIGAHERSTCLEQILRNEKITSLDQVPSLFREALSNK